jgi:glycosyltransferase involved in cell wall biosynthesis
VSDWHVISCEYPPQIGGVSSYVASVVEGLAAEGHRVHVWCPPAPVRGPEPPGVTVHRDLGRFAPRDLRRVSALLDGFPAPRRLLVQWVPHGYGYRSMNLAFCLWARRRARSGDHLDVMVHEPFLRFEGTWRQQGAAAVHRAMTVTLLSAARRVWVSTPAWRGSLQPYALGRQLGFDWLPIPSPVEPVDDPAGVAAIRSRYARGADHVIGHFGLYSPLTAEPVNALVRRVLPRVPRSVVLLIGQGSEQLRDEIVAADPASAARVHAAGVLAPAELSLHLQACDLLVQPYPEGITGRRTSAMAPLAHGKAIVTTEGAASEAVWRERGAVCLVPAADADALATAVEQLLGDPLARSRMETRARATYQELFHVAHTVEALVAS